MNRPIFNKFSAGSPVEDFNSKMREYLVYLEARDRKCSRLETERWEVSRMSEGMHKAMEENHELRRSMKVLRSQIKTMWKEEYAVQKTPMHLM